MARVLSLLREERRILGVSARYDDLWSTLWRLYDALPEATFRRLDRILAAHRGPGLAVEPGERHPLHGKPFPVDDGVMVELVTPRLVLRRWRADDVAALATINADPEVMRWIGDGSVADHARTAAEIADFERMWRVHGFGRFAVELRGSGVFVGFAGMAVPSDVPEIMPGVEIGWRFGRQYWGCGLATEAAGAALGFAFADVGLDAVVGVHVVGNDASARVMVKLGMRFDRETTENVYGRAVRVYAISRREHQRRVHPHRARLA